MKRAIKITAAFGLTLLVGYDIGFATCDWLTREAKRR